MIVIAGYSGILRIGQGGLGDVYRATRDSTGATVAVKVLRDVSDESVVWHRTRRELTALVSLAGHGNVIQLIELLELAEGPALVMEYAPGGSIAQLMTRRGEPLSVGESVFVGRHTAAALVAAHAQGIVHRDVKPQNLLIDAYGQVKLCDFGIAAMARTDEFRTRTNAISMRYASPEDLDDERDVGAPSDIYSLGATLLHLSRGAPPTLRDRLAPWEPPLTDDRDLARLDAIVAACLHPTSALRPTASGVVDELERLSWSMDERNPSLGMPSVAESAPSLDGPVDSDPFAQPAAASSSSASVASIPSGAAAPAMGHDRRGSLAPDSFATDETVHRPGRRPPPRPAPAPQPGRRAPMLAGMAVVVLLTGFAVWWWVVRDRPTDVEPSGAAATVRIVDRPAELADITTREWPIGPVGECLVQPEDDATALDVVLCDQPHDLQRVAVGALDPTVFSDDAAFDGDAVGSAVRVACDAAFEEFVGVTPAASEFDAPLSLPSAATWPTGDRSYQCLLGVSGRRIIGNAAGAGR